MFNGGDDGFPGDHPHNTNPALAWVTMTIASASDGTSNTIAVSEIVTHATPGTLLLKGGALNTSGGGMGTDGRGFWQGIETQCMNQRNPQMRTMMTGTAATDVRRGHFGFSGRAADTSFMTMLPPNSPSCQNGNSRESWGTWSASSNHPGGVNAGMFDGSGRFINDSINWKSAWVTSTWAPENGDSRQTGQPGQRLDGGPSDFGVWGALGTRAGGESVTF